MSSKFSMKAVTRLTGLSADRLRVWESRHGAVKPNRTPTGRRYYSEKDVNRLKLMAELLKLGHSIGAICALSDKELISLSSKSTKSVNLGFDDADIAELMAEIEDFKLNALRAGLARVRHLLSPQEIAFRLIPQLMAQVGAKIEEGKFSIAQEHAVSDLLRHLLRQTYDDLQPLNGKIKFTIVFGTPEGHLHDFGLLLAAIRCRFHGLETHFLGANLPGNSLIEAAKELKAGALILGISAIPPEEEKQEINAYLSALDQGLPRKISLWLGGPGIGAIRRQKMQRDTWVFVSLDELDQKLSALFRRNL